MMEFTGERYLPTLDEPEISYEHWHRYLYAREITAGKAVLDVACGEGYGGALLARRASRVVGVDRCPETVAHASGKYGSANLEFLQGDAAALPIPGEAIFDVVTCFETIEHLSVESQASLLAEIKRLLRPDGILLISSPNKLEYTDKPSYNNEFHFREFYQDEFTEFLGGYFERVFPLGQRVYPVSYIWGLGETSGRAQECQLDFESGGFAPLDDDRKACRYLVAYCSNGPLDPPDTSLLIDVSGRLLGQNPSTELVELNAWQTSRLEEYARERELFVAERDTLRGERASLVQDRDRLAGCLEAMSSDRDALARERGALIVERDALHHQRVSERESWIRVRNELWRTRDALTREHEALAREHKALTREYEALANEREALVRRLDWLVRHLEIAEGRLNRFRRSLPGRAYRAARRLWTRAEL